LTAATEISAGFVGAPYDEGEWDEESERGGIGHGGVKDVLERR
jgi:hypothetical protein